MHSSRRLLIPALALALAIPSLCWPCTTFCIREGEHLLFGRNYDWMVEDGLVMVNKRGMSKTSYSSDHPAKWTSRYGSVTFNQYGREVPTGGMNEAGLVVEVMWLQGTEYPPADERAEVGDLQWVQYQLDTAATVKEVIASDGKIRIMARRSSPIHFLVCDRGGECATVEFLGGETVVHTGDDLPVSALTNHTYRQGLSFWKSAGGNLNPESFRTASYSLKRFAWAADGVQSFDAGDEIPPVEQAFAILDRVAVADTQWRIVYDIANRRIDFRTLSRPQARHFDLASFDFSCSTPVKVLDMFDDLSGEVAGNARYPEQAVCTADRRSR